MTRMIGTAAVAVLFLAAPLFSGEQAAKKPLGTWSRTKDDATYRFTFTEDSVRFVADGGGIGKLELDGDYAVTKDGHLYGRVRKILEGTGPNAGDLFGFTFRIKGDTLTISDWRGSGAVALATVLQGEYKKTDKGK
jgi:hypothetical protein